MTPGVRFGLNLTATPGAAADLGDEARRAEELGFDVVTVHPDHPPAVGRYGTGPSFDAWTALTWVAARTTSIGLVPCVLGLPFHHPAVLAKQAETLDRLSGGRLVLGLGGGGDDAAFAAFGLASRSAREKVEATREAIGVLRGLWSAPGFDHEGEHFSLHGAAIEPRPEHPIPIWLGALGPRMADLVGSNADGWLVSMFMLDPDRATERLDRIRDAASRAGRDPDDITYGYNVPVLVREGAASNTAMLAGPADAVAVDLSGLARRGFTLLNLWPVGAGSEQVELLATEVVPAVLERLEDEGVATPRGGPASR